MVDEKPTASSSPLRIGVLLFPGFQALDAFGPLDALNILSQTQPLTLSLLSNTPDPVSTGGSKISPTFAQAIVPTSTLSQAPDLDVLIVPGGIGTRSLDVEHLTTFIANVYPRLKHMISVCTGARLVAKAGVVDGLKGTTNKKNFTEVMGLWPQVKWVGKARWVVDGKWWSGAGDSAGIDVTLAWIGEVYGRDVARDVAVEMEYVWNEDREVDPFADLYGIQDVGIE